MLGQDQSRALARRIINLGNLTLCAIATKRAHRSNDTVVTIVDCDVVIQHETFLILNEVTNAIPGGSANFMSGPEQKRIGQGKSLVI